VLAFVWACVMRWVLQRLRPGLPNQAEIFLRKTSLSGCEASVSCA
jgi:hypothetical protein